MRNIEFGSNAGVLTGAVVLAASLGVAIAISSRSSQEQDGPEGEGPSEPAVTGMQMSNEDAFSTRADAIRDRSIDASERDVEGEGSGLSPSAVDPDNGAQTAAGSNADREHPVTELRSMSQTFRNTTFLIAIRGAGFYCDAVVSANESADGVWLASCADRLGYTLNVLDIDRFEVRPVVHYFDGVGPVPVERDRPLERR